ncbi:hypothetical protein, variant [Aphanomyces invadans]|uniref:Uncharacterized protein n=1 Tax=Aphanomyces invadans TaxID=157072 RepID=A0A024TCG1_9STRA|nr:hypothetical protein, variant [Aphanomyces invadans]ETV91017.1 hypothetical protein, variant [Aphanomyces invadans]|eukprot:XP_008880406.1 hypothetical protein, variant [Aphanomyces invadans]
MAQVTRKRVEHVGAAAQCEWKQVHLDATSARMTFAASLRDRAHALWRCLRHEDASESFPSAHDILATEPDDSALGLHCGRGAATDLDGDRRAAHLRKWAGHERWNVDAAHAAQLRAVDLAWNAYREVLTSQVSADLATCDRMPSAARAMKQRQLVRAAFDAAMETAELRQRHAVRQLDRQHRDLHAEIDAKDVELKFVAVVRDQAVQEFRRLDAWIHVCMYDRPLPRRSRLSP